MTKRLPPDPENQNDERAEWAASALRDFQRRTGTDDEDTLSDLLCDLMHWSDRNNCDFGAELSRARMHYEAETAAECCDEFEAVTQAQKDLLNLLEAAEKVIARWETGDLAGAVRELSAAVANAKGGAK